MKKCVFSVDDAGSIYDKDGSCVGALTCVADEKEYKENEAADITLQLVKQGLTVDDIVKLKNADLI